MSKATSLREPSMEEVLASIRRIIESGEEREVAREAGVAPPAASADASASVQPTAMVVPYRTVFDGAAAGAAESLRGTFDDQAETVVDEGAIDFGALADDEIAAALADFGNGNGNEQSTGPVQTGFVAVPVPEGEPLRAGNENAVALRHLDLDRVDEPEPDHALQPFEPTLRRDESGDLPWDDMSDASDGANPVAPVGAGAGAMPQSVIDGASALLSAQAGEQVAAAFDDLARAIRGGPMQSMDTMAREMLRPMLQEWLDDNLPRLVERMVREEIERIARGPRR